MISLSLVKIRYLEPSEKNSILSANSASRTAIRNSIQFSSIQLYSQVKYNVIAA